MTVSFLLINTKKSGGNKFVFNIANRLIEEGHGVSIFSVFRDEVDWFPLKVSVKKALSLKNFFLKPDILMATFWPTAYLSLLFPAKEKIYFVQNWETLFYKNPIPAFLAKLSVKLPLRIITISKFIKDNIAKFRKDKIDILPLTCDSFIFKVDPLLQRSKDIRIITILSTYDEFKGAKELVWTIEKLKTKHPSWKFILISFEKNPPSNIFDGFYSTPPIEKIVKELNKASVFLLTSKVEGFPLPPLEAMACGIPVVVTDSGGVREYAEHEYNCLLAKDEKEIIEKGYVERIINSPGIRRALRENGLKTVRQYNWARTMRVFEDYIRDKT